MKQLVMGAACGYSADQLQHFLKSLRKTGYQGDIALLTYNADSQVQKLFEQTQTQALPIHPATLSGRYRFLYQVLPSIFSMKKFKADLWRVAELWMHIQNGRYVAYRRFLENWTERYDEVFLCDIRDAIFQLNPFEANHDYTIGFFEEYAKRPICNCPDNASWIQQGYGKKAYQELKDETIVCSGITYLKSPSILPYLDAMINGMAKANVRNHIDQGIHNFLARRGNLQGAKIVPQAESPVLNIGCNPFDTLRFDDSGRLLNEAGELAAIVHQYDRHPQLQASLPEILC